MENLEFKCSSLLAFGLAKNMGVSLKDPQNPTDLDWPHFPDWLKLPKWTQPIYKIPQIP